MLCRFSETATIDGDLATVWRTAIDVANWAQWDPHFKVSRFEGVFEPGAIGWTRPKGAPLGSFVVLKVEPERFYATESRMPGGKMVIENTFTQAGPGKVTVRRQNELHGGFVPIFKLFYLKAMQRDLRRTLQELGNEARRRAAAAGSNR